MTASDVWNLPKLVYFPLKLIRWIIGTGHEEESEIRPTDLNSADKALVERLEEAKNTIGTIRSLSKVPSVSYIVVHEGRKILENSVGFRELESRTSANSKSVYTLCSVSKSFISAAFGILVDEGKVKWADTPSKYLPDFKPNDPRVATEATFNDILRHSSGIDNPVTSLLGPGGKVLVPKHDFIRVLNESPTERHGSPNFNSWVYSNIGYGLVVLVIEKVSGESLSEFLQKRILDPLGMKHTAVTSSQLNSMGNNIAQSYAQTSDGSWKRMEHEWTDEKNSPVLGMIGIRSSTHDMAIYTVAFMQAYVSANLSHSPRDDAAKTMEAFPVLNGIKENPIKQISAIVDDYYWIKPSDDQYGVEARYHLGWVKVRMPSSMVSWGSYNETLADNASSEEDQAFRNANILGQDSGSGNRLLIKSTGVGFCGTCCVLWLPQTRTAIIVLSSGTNDADAADFSASALLQAVFDLKPKIEIIPMVEYEIRSKKKGFQKILRDLEEHRDVSRAEAEHTDYLGEYYGLGITLVVRESSEKGQMELCFNKREDSVQKLEYYNQDQYSYWPKTRDEWLAGGWLDWDYYLVGLLTFERDEALNVSGVTWVWEEDADPYVFTKVTDNELRDGTLPKSRCD